MKTTLLVAAVLASVGLVAACSPSGQTPAEHSAADRSTGHTSSSAGLPVGQVAAGGKLAATRNPKTGQSCIDCHGPSGNAPIDPTYPKLGGQYYDYIAHSLQMYRDGDRANVLMASQAAELTDQQIADLAAWFGAQPTQLRDLSHL